MTPGPAPGRREGRAPLPWPATALLSLAATLLGWRSVPWRVAAPGLDSWQAALALGYQHHLQWGPQVLFTFGPFGFAEDVLPYFRATAAIGLAFALAMSWASAALVLSALRPSWGTVPASLATWAVVCLASNTLETSQLATAVALGLALACLSVSSQRAQARLGAALGALAGFEVLVEISAGLVCTGLFALSMAYLVLRGGRALPQGPGPARPRPVRAGPLSAGPLRTVLAAVGAFVGLPLVALAAGGQSLGNLGSYLVGSFQVVLGYAPAMATSTGRVAEDWFGLGEAVLLAVTAWSALRHQGRAVRLSAAVMLAGWGWAALKEGYVRHDTHDVVFLSLVMVAIALAGLVGLPRGPVPTQAAALALSGLMVVLANGGLPASLGAPWSDVRSFATEVADLGLGRDWAHTQAVGRFQERLLGGVLPGWLLHDLSGVTMAAAPWEDSLAFTYPELHWDPLPVVQSYNAYTPYLDHLDAGFLLGPRAPRRLLFQPATVDGRNPWWVPPAASEAMLCRYRQLATVAAAPHRATNPPTPVLGESAWQVLGLVPDRCGPARALGSVTTTFGHTVQVPAPTSPGEMVVAELSFGQPLGAALEGVLLKPPPVHLEGLAGRPAVPVRYRLVSATAGEAHVMTTPRSLGYSLGYTPPQLHSFELSGGGWRAGTGRLTARFYEVAVRPAGTGRSGR